MKQPPRAVKAHECVRIELNHPMGFRRANRKADAGGLSRPIVKKKKWNDLPGWIMLHAERGAVKKCWNGCKLHPAVQDGRTYGWCQVRGCDWRPPAGAPILACTKCKWSVCANCKDRPRMPMLNMDPLFHGPDDPCLLQYPQFEHMVGRGTVIVCPGGNYEFLSPLEGLPVVEWLAQHGIGAVVLRYRLLPDYGLDDCLDDLESAAMRIRALRPGPVAALGFSAGGHLIASLALRAARQGKKQPLDAQVLVYPGIDGRDWRHESYNGFFNKGKWKIPSRAETLHAGQEDLLGGDGFAAPATCLVGSTDDTCTPNEQHTDIYHAALMKREIPNVYLRDAFGEHGFELKGGWTPGCVRWLHSRGFGGKPEMKEKLGVHRMSLRSPAPRVENLGEQNGAEVCEKRLVGRRGDARRVPGSRLREGGRDGGGESDREEHECQPRLARAAAGKHIHIYMQHRTLHRTTKPLSRTRYASRFHSHLGSWGVQERGLPPSQDRDAPSPPPPTTRLLHILTPFPPPLLCACASTQMSRWARTSTRASRTRCSRRPVQPLLDQHRRDRHLPREHPLRRRRQGAGLRRVDAAALPPAGAPYLREPLARRLAAQGPLAQPVAKPEQGA